MKAFTAVMLGIGAVVSLVFSVAFGLYAFDLHRKGAHKAACAEYELTLRAAAVCETRGACLLTLTDVERIGRALREREAQCK
jgi:hypothetical protein